MRSTFGIICSLYLASKLSTETEIAVIVSLYLLMILHLISFDKRKCSFMYIKLDPETTCQEPADLVTILYAIKYNFSCCQFVVKFTVPDRNILITI